jgi:DNA-binding NarL/FixJ family response regulator
VLDAGLQGYMPKSCDPRNLVACIKTLADGGTNFSSECTELVLSRNKMTQEPCLNSMENEVLCLLCKGKKTPEIAVTVNKSEGTINGYRLSIAEKLGTANHFLQAIYAIYHGLVDPKDCLDQLGKR